MEENAYFDTSIELGKDSLESSRAEVFEMIDKMEKERAEASLSSTEIAEIIKDLHRLTAGSNSTKKAKNDSDMKELLCKAKEGSKTAQNILTCLENNDLFIEMWDQAPPRNPFVIEELIDALYTCLSSAGHHFKLAKKMHFDVLQFIIKLHQTIGGKKSKLDMQLRLCLFYLQSGFERVKELQAEVLEEGVRRYPDEIPLYRDLSNAHAFLYEYRKGLEVCINGLLKAPNDPDLLFYKAGHLCYLNESRSSWKKVRDAFNQFIENAPVDHRMLPEAYYCIGLSYTMETKMKKKEVHEMTIHYYRLGEEAEKVQLSCHLPYESHSKGALRNFVMGTKNEKNPLFGLSGIPVGGINGSGEERNVSKEKLYLKDTKRIEMIKKHRELAERARKVLEMPYQISTSVTPKLVHKIPKSLNELKAITLQEMNPTKDQIYEGRFLNLTVIEGPFFGRPSIPLVAEDDNGDTTRIVIYNVEQNEEAKKTFGVGAKFAVINPYMRMAADGNAIRVDDPKCLIHNEGVKDMCRYCGKEGAKSSCSRCQKAKYRGKQCQEMDWKILKHRLICFDEGK